MSIRRSSLFPYAFIGDFFFLFHFRYLPLNRKVHVRNSPISDIEFTQLRGNIRGRIIKIPDSAKGEEMTIKLKRKNSLVAIKVLEENKLEYSFTDMMPGYYDVEIEKQTWCFEKEIHSVTVTSAETLVPDFVHSGFKIKIKSSHRTSILVTNNNNNNNNTSDVEFHRELVLEKGDNSFCIPYSMGYKLKPFGCHGYDREFYIIDPNSSEDGLILNAISHDVTGFIKSSDYENDVFVDVVSNGQTTR